MAKPSKVQSAQKPSARKPVAKKVTRKTRVLQSEVPRHSIQEAAQIADAIAVHYASAATKPLHLAGAMDLSVTSSLFRMLIGASAAYGLTTGAFDSAVIALTPLGKRVVDAKSDGEKRTALNEAFLRPRVIGALLRKYDNARFPKDQVAEQVLTDLGVPTDSIKRTIKLIFDGANALGLIRENKGNHYVDLAGMPSVATTPPSPSDNPDNDEEEAGRGEPQDAAPVISSSLGAATPLSANNRVFITHGKNLEIVKQLKELLTYGKFDPIVAAEHETISKPVSDKVMDDMRSCSAAIIHVGKEIKLLDHTGDEHIFLNQNVLIEIGAAMALYKQKFILLVERGATLPSNLLGLYEVRYEGDKLDYEATMKLLKAFNDFRQ